MSYLQGNIITNIDDAEAASPTMVVRFGKKAGNKSQPKNRKPGKRIASLTTEDLRDDAKLLDWFNEATKRRNRVLRDNETDRLNVFAAAERALEVGDNPPALFAHIVGEQQWQLISCEQEDRGWQRLKRLRNPGREPQRRHDYDDAEPRPEPCSIGDIVRDLVKSFLPTNPNPSDENHA